VFEGSKLLRVQVKTNGSIVNALCSGMDLCRAALCNASLKHRFSLPSDALELLFELSQFIRRQIREDFLHRRNVLLKNWRDDAFPAGG
jgi:hypothetical protein